jgi:hypothetical protein
MVLITECQYKIINLEVIKNLSFTFSVQYGISLTQQYNSEHSNLSKQYVIEIISAFELN